jgi:hypothetical protein
LVAVKADWSRRFNDPIPPPKGRQLVTLKDAGNYITKLSKAEHEAQEWQAAMEALILVATSGGHTMFARIGVMRALNHGHVREFNYSRKDPHWGRRKLKREHVMDNKDAFDLWWEWADKPVDNKPTIDAAVYDAVMALPPDERRDRAKVNEAVRDGLRLGPLRPAGSADLYGVPRATD